MIIEILLSTSYRYCKWLICRIERKGYISGKGQDEFNTEWAYLFGHLERAIHSEDFIPDKREFLQKFLWIPFCRRTGKLYRKSMDRRELSEAEISERIYQFYFVNILSAFQNFNGDDKHLERNQLYMCIRDFVSELSNKYDERWMYVYHMALSGILNGLISSNVEDKAEFCNFLLSKCISDHGAARKQLNLFILFQEMLNLAEDRTAPECIVIRRFGSWEPIREKDVAFYAEFWKVWGEMYEFPFDKKMQSFEVAMQTMSGRRNSSAVISRLLLTMTKQDKIKWRDDGEEHSNKDIAVEK